MEVGREFVLGLLERGNIIKTEWGDKYNRGVVTVWFVNILCGDILW